MINSRMVTIYKALFIDATEVKSMLCYAMQGEAQSVHVASRIGIRMQIMTL